MTVPQLKQRCKDEGLPVSGRKSDLIERLREKGGKAGNVEKEKDQEKKGSDATKKTKTK